jgi:hypothetical protein
LNQIQNSSQGTTGSAATPDNRKSTWIAVCSLIANAILVCVVIFAFVNMNAAKPQANAPTQNPTVSSNTASNSAGTQSPGSGYTPPPTPVNATPSVTPSTPPQQQTPTPPASPPASPPSQTVTAFDSTVIINKQASQMALTSADMGQGWLKSTAYPPSKAQANSITLIQYIQGGAFSPKVLNMVAVFRSIQAAQNTYEMEKPATATLSYPHFGDECFLSDSVLINKELVFRKNNVVVWIWVQNDKSGDPEHYAEIILGKVSP